ncbi:unnamed protein product [Darwinula stevensoni]|uniref:Uncharacterized protein n=1 Tax=Darwinula stevensoni TaxID=69355 RepID=A0A7R8XJK5_9CRUS|nr:unnamed protein product [Darwinula stevensoni]CAG0895430.1 unnamed protein product [Darwinula stevensoni]
MKRRFTVSVILSRCSLASSWIFYSEYFYNYQNEGRVEWVYGDGFAHNLNNVNNLVSSLRFVGDEDNWKMDSITLFEFDLFFGIEYYDWTDNTQVPSGMSTVGSLIITGQNYWTVYTSTNFSGNRACLQVQSGQYVGFAADLDEYGIFTVRSYRRGCFGDKKITLNSDQHGFAVKARE